MRITIFISFLIVVVVLSVAKSNGASIKSVINVCFKDSECGDKAKFCDHHFPNPMGSCAKKHKNGEKCTFDRHCMSDKCNWNKCVASKPKKDGPCSKEQHHECIDSQYCSSQNRCKDRHANGGGCIKDQHCMSNKCSLFKCKASQTSNNNAGHHRPKRVFF